MFLHAVLRGSVSRSDQRGLGAATCSVVVVVCFGQAQRGDEPRLCLATRGVA